MTDAHRRTASRPLRLLTVAETFFYDHRNGLARVAWDVCRGLARRGHEVTLVAPAPVNAVHEQVLEGVRVVRFPQPAVSGFSPWNPGRRTDAYAAALEPFAATAWDCVHCHGIYGAAAAARVVRHRSRLILTIHSPAVDEQRWNWSHGRLRDVVKLAGLPLIRRAEKHALGVADACHTLSRFTRDRMAALYPWSESKPWAVIPHWSSSAWRRTLSVADARDKLGWPRDEPVILAVRQLRSRYGLDAAIRAMASLAKNRPCILRIVGQGELRDQLERLAAALGVAERVSFSGGLSDAELVLAYQAADVAIVPSRALECFGVIAIEALGFGVPVVATAVGGLPEILGPIMPDLVVPPDDPAALARAMGAVLDGNAATPTREAMVDFVETRYSEERLLDEYEAILSAGVTAASEVDNSGAGLRV